MITLRLLTYFLFIIKFHQLNGIILKGEIDRIEIINCLTYEINRYGTTNEYGAKDIIEDKDFYIPFAKVDLLTKTYEKKDVIWVDNTTEIPTEHIDL